MEDQQFYADLEKDIHSHFLMTETEQGQSLEDVVDIDDLVDEVLIIFKNRIDQYVQE